MAPIHTDRASWVAAGGIAERLDILARVGKIATFTDGDARCLAAIHPDRPTAGTIGDWVGEPAVLTAAEAWLKDQGCIEAFGPMLMCPWFPYRANLGPYDAEPLALEPTEPGDRWEEAGWDIAATYVSILAGHSANINAAMTTAGRLASRGWSVGPIETGPSSAMTEATFRGVIEEVHAVAELAFADKDGFVNVPCEVLEAFYGPYRGLIDPRLALVARTPTGQAAAFLLALPDHAQPDRRWFQILTMAVAPEHRHLGLATWMVASAHQAAHRAGFTAGIHAMVRADDGLEDTTWYRGKIIRRYGLFRRDLQTGPSAR